MFAFPHRSHEIDGSIYEGVGPCEPFDRDEDGLERGPLIIGTREAATGKTADPDGVCSERAAIGFCSVAERGDATEVGESVNGNGRLDAWDREPRSLVLDVDTRGTPRSDSVARLRLGVDSGVRVAAV